MIVALLSAALAAPPGFSPELQVRPRFEVDTGEDAAAGGERFFVIQRSRLGGSVLAGPVTFRGVVQDSRVWGTESDPGKVTAEDFDFRIASIRVDLGEDVSITAGRQELRWHEQRLLAIANWQPVGRVFDAVRLDAEQGAMHLQAFGAITAEGDAEAYEEEGLTAGLLAGVGGDGGFADFVYLYDGDQNVGRQRHTAGVYATGEQGALSGRIEGYMQRGALDGASISTGMIGVNATVTLPVRGVPKLTAWYDLMSGDDDITDDESTAFVMVYGAKHKFMGIADIVYYQLAGPTDGQGLHNPALKLSASPAENLRLFVDGHAFLAATDGSYIGSEVDVKAAYVLAKGVTMSAGTGAFVGQSRPTDIFGWLMLDARL